MLVLHSMSLTAPDSVEPESPLVPHRWAFLHGIAVPAHGDFCGEGLATRG